MADFIKEKKRKDETRQRTMLKTLGEKMKECVGR
jgi:hypothetical protein